MDNDYFLPWLPPIKRTRKVRINHNYNQDYASKALSSKARYTVLVEVGHRIPSFESYINTIAFYNRTVNKFRKEYGLSTSHFSLLMLILKMTKVRRSNQVCLKTIITNYLSASGAYNKIISQLYDLQKMYMIKFEYSGKVTGSKISTTMIGQNVSERIYKEFQDVMGIYPQNK